MLFILVFLQDKIFEWKPILFYIKKIINIIIDQEWGPNS